MRSLELITIASSVGLIVVSYLVWQSWKELTEKLDNKYNFLEKKRALIEKELIMLKEKNSDDSERLLMLENLLFIVEKNTLIKEDKKRKAIDKLLECYFEVQTTNDLELSDILQDIIAIVRFNDRLEKLSTESIQSSFSDDTFNRVNDIESELADKA